MTEPFRVPERLQLAIRPGRGDEPFRSVMDVVDVPALCRAEVERALEEARRTGFWTNVSSLRWRTDYLAQRYGEAAPVPKDPPSSPLHCAHTMCQRDECTACFPTPSAPAEAKEESVSETAFTQSFDARDWVKAFVETVRERPSIATDESIMLGWFANALMRGYDEHARRQDQDAVGAAPPLEAPAKTCGHVQSGECANCHFDKVQRQQAAARPEAEGFICAAPGCRNVVSSTDEFCPSHSPSPIVSLCHACPCATCMAEREFVRALAKNYAGADTFFHPDHPLVAAARRVREEAP